jgi:hypothetical protein
MVSFACDMTALSIDQRSRHRALGNSLRADLSAVHELPNGYEFEFPLNPATYTALTKVTLLEHACCPFFGIVIRLEQGKLFWQLTGTDGVKPFIQAEFAQWFK